jgi:hypothetical protein
MRKPPLAALQMLLERLAEGFADIPVRRTKAKHAQLEIDAAQALQQNNNEKYDQLRAEQKALGIFRPWMNHSLTEKSPTVVFHQQLLDDYKTIDEFGQKILQELAIFDEKKARAKQLAWAIIKSKLRGAKDSIQALFRSR